MLACYIKKSAEYHKKHTYFCDCGDLKWLNIYYNVVVVAEFYIQKYLSTDSYTLCHQQI